MRHLPLPKQGNPGLRLRCHLQLRTNGRVDRVRYVRGEGGMMRASSQPTGRSNSIVPEACFQSSHTTLRRCQTWGERPNVIHTGWRSTRRANIVMYLTFGVLLLDWAGRLRIS